MTMATGKLRFRRNLRTSVMSACLALAIAAGIGAFSVLAMHSAITALQYSPPEVIETVAAVDHLL